MDGGISLSSLLIAIAYVAIPAFVIFLAVRAGVRSGMRAARRDDISDGGKGGDA